LKSSFQKKFTPATTVTKRDTFIVDESISNSLEQPVLSDQKQSAMKIIPSFDKAIALRDSEAS
jgi:hypothetical protein